VRAQAGYGKHLPVGNDALKACHLLLMTTGKHAGTMVPPTYWGILRA
jgi:hypothetical protein